MIKIFLTIISVLSVSFMGAAFAQETVSQPTTESKKTDYEVKYLEILDDVPLMQGLELVPEATLVFDKPDGRIAETSYFSSSVTSEEITAYYSEVLPQLGWQMIDPFKYAREQDHLVFTPSQNNEESLVIFYLSPLKNTHEK
ncbi:MAG: hypothetical protein ACPG05_01025 [Bdellovibrionales bacterium]